MFMVYCFIGQMTLGYIMFCLTQELSNIEILFQMKRREHLVWKSKRYNKSTNIIHTQGWLGNTIICCGYRCNFCWYENGINIPQTKKVYCCGQNGHNSNFGNISMVAVTTSGKMLFWIIYIVFASCSKDKEVITTFKFKKKWLESK
jgi:hypothetical protein